MNFIKSVKKELHKVNWLGTKGVGKRFLTVMIFSIIIIGYFTLLDGLVLGIKKLF